MALRSTASAVVTTHRERRLLARPRALRGCRGAPARPPRTGRAAHRPHDDRAHRRWASSDVIWRAAPRHAARADGGGAGRHLRPRRADGVRRPSVRTRDGPAGARPDRPRRARAAARPRESRTWPALGPGLALLTIPSLVYDFTDPSVVDDPGATALCAGGLARRRRVGLVVVGADAGASRRRSCSGSVVLLVHAVAQLWPWISDLYARRASGGCGSGSAVRS